MFIIELWVPGLYFLWAIYSCRESIGCDSGELWELECGWKAIHTRSVWYWLCSHNSRPEQKHCGRMALLWKGPPGLPWDSRFSPAHLARQRFVFLFATWYRHAVCFNQWNVRAFMFMISRRKRESAKTRLAVQIEHQRSMHGDQILSS